MTGIQKYTGLWPYHNVQPVAKPDWATLLACGPAWLWLDGAGNESLQAEVAAIANPFSLRWVWRNTDWEYAGPGYRQGPLLVPLDEPMMGHYLSNWSVRGLGMILSAPDEANLLVHLQHLRHITAANGDRVHFSLRAVRRFEELCEGLSATRLSELLGPIQSLLWPVPDEPAGWRCIANNVADGRPLAHDGTFRLHSAEEQASAQASLRTFYRFAAAALATDYPETVERLGADELQRQIHLFIGEAQRIELLDERDVFHYLRLRFVYPQEAFLHNHAVRAVLSKTNLSARMRVHEAEHILQRPINTKA